MGAHRLLALALASAATAFVTRDDPKLNDQFKIYLVDWYMHRVYDELNGPLADAIASIPPR